MRVTFDPDKRDRTLKDRGLAFEDAVELFEGRTLDRVDAARVRRDARGTVGHLRGRLVISWCGRNAVTLATSFR